MSESQTLHFERAISLSSPSAPDPLSPLEARIHERATAAARQYQRSEADLMEALIAVGESKVFLRLGYSSLFRYANEALALSEAVAYAAVAIARKASLVPPLREAVGSGELGFSKAKKILSVLNPRDSADAQAVWVNAAVVLSSRKLERAVAAENPQASVSERIVYKTSRRIEMTLGIREEILLDFRQAQNLVSAGRAGAADLEATLAELLRFYLDRKDPVRIAKRVIAKKGLGSGEQEADGLRPVRIPVSAALRHRVRLRDGNSCQAPMPGGKKCSSRRWLDIHHRIPISEGGGNTFENLTTLCRAHHQAHHAQESRMPKSRRNLAQ
jgi:hypothetical protein